MEIFNLSFFVSTNLVMQYYMSRNVVFYSNKKEGISIPSRRYFRDLTLEFVVLNRV